MSTETIKTITNSSITTVLVIVLGTGAQDVHLHSLSYNMYSSRALDMSLKYEWQLDLGQ